MNPHYQDLWKWLFFLLITTTISVSAVPGLENRSPASANEAFTAYILYPPSCLEVNAVECMVYTQWQKPELPGGGTPPGLVGYWLYRNGFNIAYISDPDDLFYYDDDVEPGIYLDYWITAKYDLTPYGYPGQYGESDPSSTASITLICILSFPFNESWDNGSFAYNDWKFSPDQSNWSIEINLGNPLPSTKFSGIPEQVNYSYSLISPFIPGNPTLFESITLSFDYKLMDLVSSASENMVIETWYDSIWHPVLELTNNGSVDWTTIQEDISDVLGHTFRLRFRATGENSSRISGWMLDNIMVDGVSVGISTGKPQSIKIYPTIVFDHIIIETDDLLNWLQIFDNQGKIVLKQNLNHQHHTQIDISSFEISVVSL